MNVDAWEDGMPTMTHHVLLDVEMILLQGMKNVRKEMDVTRRYVDVNMGGMMMGMDVVRRCVEMGLL